jgi:hypothetical protein
MTLGSTVLGSSLDPHKSRKGVSRECFQTNNGRASSASSTSSTFVTSIPALLLFQPVLDDPVGYIASAGQDNRIFFGVLLELLLIIANIGTAVVIYPIVRRQSVELALG